MKRSRSQWTEIIVFAAAIVVLYFGLAYAVYTGVSSTTPGANDFYSRWVGARALFLRGENPYSASVTREIQLGMYGRLAREDEDQVAFAYPLYASFLAFPLVGLAFAQAQALWMAFLIVAVIVGSIAIAKTCHVGNRPLWLLSLVVGVILFYPSVRAIFLGQFAIISFACVALACRAIQGKMDALAGILLAVATVKPQPALFLVPIILLWAARHGRWRMVIGAVGTLGALAGVATILVPTWLLDFIAAVRAYTQYEPIGPPLQILAEWALPAPWGFYLWTVMALGLVAWLFGRAFEKSDQPFDGFLDVVVLAAIVTTLTAGRVGSSDQVLLLFPWLYWMARWTANGKRRHAALLSLVFVLLPWIVFLGTIRGNSEYLGVILILPFLSLALYVWQRNLLSRWVGVAG